jgi:hypothetical protein
MDIQQLSTPINKPKRHSASPSSGSRFKVSGCAGLVASYSGFK